MTAFKVIALLVFPLLLGACDSGPGGDLPPVRPAGSISGKAAAGAIVGAQVVVYGLTPNGRGTRLGAAQTGVDGSFEIPIRAADQPILLELSGGQYVEEASGKTVKLVQGQVLRSVGLYTSGQHLALMLTPLSHMVAALAEHNIANGLVPAQAIAEAKAAVDAFFALNVQAVRPADVTVLPADTAADTTADGPSAETLYGLYLAGLSYWTQWFGQGDTTQWNSIVLAQTLYQDLRADGLLDGRGDDPDVALGFATQPLDADAYRLAFSLHMLAFSQGPRNQSGFAAKDLLAAARAMAAQTALVPEPEEGDAKPAPLDGQAPKVTVQQLVQANGSDTLFDLEAFADQAHSGTFMLQVSVGGLLGAHKLTTSIVDANGEEIDGEPQENKLDGSGQILVIVDTANYDDGDYGFTLTAEDTLGKRTVERFQVEFDNTAPTLAVTSASSTNQPTTTISGTYHDKIAGVAAIAVAGQEATLFDNVNWQIDDVALSEGANTFPIEVIDLVGNRRSDVTTTVYFDQTLPSIDSTNRHSQALFSNGDGSVTEGTLQDSNGILYVESDHADLGGSLIDRAALNAAGIPYFAFTVSDDTAPDMPTAAADIQVSMQYRRNDQVLSAWHPLTAVGDEYLIPLAAETLAADWHQAKPTDQHVIDIAVTDPAGNTSTTQFDFYADVYVPAFDIANDNGDASNHIDDVGQPLFANTTFADRADLNVQTFASTAYTFRNTTGKAFYLSLGDDATHTTGQVVEQLVRENRIQKKTSTEWQIRQLTPSDFCPQPTPWTPTDYVWNWNGNDWEKIMLPAPTYGPEEIIYSETPPPSVSDWAAVPDFDQNFFQFPVPDPTYTYWVYVFDYTLDKTWPPDAAYLRAWSRQLTDSGAVETCDPQRYFEQRETYVYENVDGYPQGVLSTQTIADTPTFGTSGFTVRDDDTSVVIEPVGGWYRIPAGDSVTITKQVTTPVLTLHNEDISDPSSATYTARLKDKTLTWRVDQGLDITVIHDAGEANLADMPQRSLHVGSGVSVYQLSR